MFTKTDKALRIFEGAYLSNREARKTRVEAFNETMWFMGCMGDEGQEMASLVWSLWFDPNRTDPLTNEELWFLA